MIIRRKSVPSTRLSKGQTARLVKTDGEFAKMFIGNIGTVVGKCKLYKGAYVVQFGDYKISVYADEIEIVGQERLR